MTTYYLGGYTRSDNRGIHQVILNDRNEVVEASLIIKESNPTYLAISKDEQHLYSLSDRGNLPGVVHYQKIDDSWTEVGRCTFLRHNGSYLSLDEERQLLYVANYHEGNIAVIRIAEDGSLALRHLQSHFGSGPHPNQDQSHAHYSHVTLNGKYVLVCDLGTDTVTTYELDEADNLKRLHSYKSELGSGMRHLDFHPNGKVVYAVGELSYTVDVLRLHSDGSLERVQRVELLDELSQYGGASAIHLSKDGNFLYVSSRGEDKLSVFSISEDGEKLERIQIIDTDGDFPRDFILSDDGSLVMVGHQKESAVNFFKRDLETGLLTRLDISLEIPEIVCLARPE